MGTGNPSEMAAKDLATTATTTTTQKYLTTKREYMKHLQKVMVKGDTWYLIESHWNRQLNKYLGLDDGSCTGNGESTAEVDASAHPGKIDNSPLFNKDSEDPEEILESLMTELDYVVVPEEAWQVLVRDFGLTEGQQSIARKVVEQGLFVKHCKVEVYKSDLLLAESSDLEKNVKKKFSKADTLLLLVEGMRRLFDIPGDIEVRLWVKYPNNTFEHLTNLTATVHDSGLLPGHMVIIERKNADGTWSKDGRFKSTVLNSSLNIESGNGVETAPGNSEGTKVEFSKPSTSADNFFDSRSKTFSATARRRAATPTTSNNYDTAGMSDNSAQPGLCGLSNLGNTCFMNSIIQGLSNTPPITEYFTLDNYVEDINEENPLGMKGEIARSFGGLIKSMWSGKYSYVVPRNFKTAVGRFAPQFSGYQQQDSQELLTFLLDGLHEDLNRVKKKPYIEIKDSAGRPDEEVAAESWEVYKKRNDSVILDLFHGLLKSTVVCPECPKISITFDPFCYLSLPLPIKKERQIEVFLVFRDKSKCPTQYKVTCPKDGCMIDLCAALSKLSGLPHDRMIVTDVYNHRFHKIFNADEGLHQILERDDIFVYEVPTTQANHPDIAIASIYLREKKSPTTYSPSNLFGQPLLLGLPRDNVTYEALYEHVLTSLSRYVTPPEDDVVWWNNSQANDACDGNVVAVNGNNNSPGDEFSYDKDLAMDDEEEDDGRGPPKLFTINVINAYGNSQMEELRNDGKSLNVTAKHYLSLDWHPVAKKLYYNEKAAEDVAQDESYHAKPAEKKEAVSLSDCLELYTTKEKLGEANTWRCPSCKKDQQATKKFDLWSLPSILVISLKRFSFNRHWRDKLDTMVDFPVQGLDMAPYIINKNHGPAVYDLIAVSNHFGGMGGGHYTAFARNKNNGQWYNFDDSSVTSVREDSIVTKAAYVLFYQRRDANRAYNSLRPASSKIHPKGNSSSEEEMEITEYCGMIRC